MIGVIGLLAFAIRLVFPIGSSFFNLQFSFFSSYIFLFFLGIFARQKALFDQIDSSKAKRWGVLTFVVEVPWWIVNAICLKTNDLTPLLGGWHWLALSYALLGFFKQFLKEHSPVQVFLSSHSFGVYVFHAPILIAISLLLRGVTLPLLVKWALLIILTLPITYFVAYIARKIPYLGKIFS